MESAVDVARAICTYLWNTSPAQYVRDIYGDDHHSDYLNEKIDTYARSQLRALGDLDSANFVRFVTIACERYGRSH